MKSGLVKRVLSVVMATVLLAGNVMPVMAQGVSVSANTVEIEEASESELNLEETVVEETTVEDIVGEETVDSEQTQEMVSENEVSEVEPGVSENTTETPKEDTDVSENDVTVSENEASKEVVSENEIVDEEVPLSAAPVVSLDSVSVNGITITVSGPASAFAEGTTVSAVEVEPAEVVIEAAEENEKAEVKRYKAFDINLVCNGEIVQPLNGEEITVNFEGDLVIPDTDKEEDVAVYHVDDNDKITKMEAEVTPVTEEGEMGTETVEMVTTHFSTYVILVTGDDGEVKVTINHYYNDGTRLFIAQEKNVERGGSITNFVKGEDDFSVARMEVDGKTYIPDGEGDFEYTVDTKEDTLIIDVYYNAAISDKVTTVPFTLIDYDDYVRYHDRDNGSAYREDSINYYKNYESYEPVTYEEVVDEIKETHPKGWYGGDYISDERYEEIIRWIFRDNYKNYDLEKDKKNWDDRFATKGAYLNYEQMRDNVDGESVKVNDYNSEKPKQVIKGLLLNLSGDNYENVNFLYEDPGFFTAEENQYGTKKIYDDYLLGFVRDGIGYTLQDVRRGNENNVVWTELNRFFPLSKDPNSEEINEYFGMRYDFTFKIGDYVGDMTYTFSGDDDLWVCIDGEVILDLGGIHQRVQGSVNIWEVLLDKPNPSYEDKVAFLTAGGEEEVHTISVIYMERGGSQSNCEMQFVMPNIIPSDPVTSKAPKADVELVKKDSVTGEKIEGVGFTLYSDYTCQTEKGHEQKTDADGKVSFKDLREGTYYLKETTYDAEKYQENETIYIVEVKANRDSASATITNLSEKEGNAYVVYNTPVLKTDIEFIKVDSKDSSIILAGAQFELTSTSDVSFKKTATSDKNGKVLFEDIEAGVYTLKETKAPEGYSLPLNETLTITVEVKDGEIGYTVSEDEKNNLLQYTKDGEKHLLKNKKALGALKITKTVNRVDLKHGVAAFLFKITSKKDGSVLYRTISFEENSESDVTKSVIIADLPVGEYTVEELSALRYECKTDMIQPKNVVEDEVTEYTFRNEKDFENNYSHTDVVVNKVTFNKDASGKITSATISQEKTSTSDVINE